MADLSANALEHLRASTEALNQLSDSAAQVVRDAESFLEENRVTEYTEVSLGLGAFSPEADSPDYEDFLCYYKHPSGRFRIGIARRYVDHTDHDLAPWAESSRDDKLSSFEKLPELLTKISENVKGRVQRARQTVEAVNASLKFPSKKKGGN